MKMREILSKDPRQHRRIPAILMTVLLLFLSWTMLPAQKTSAADQPREVEISIYGNKSSVEYDGEEHSVSGYTMRFYFPKEEYETIILPEGLSVTYKKDQSDLEAKGTDADNVYWKALDWNDFDIVSLRPDEYTIYKEYIDDIRLTIYERNVTITAKDQEYVYNGEPQGESDPAYDDPNVIADKIVVSRDDEEPPLVDGDTVTGIVLSGQATNVGDQYTIEPSQASIGKDPDFTYQYNITYVPGKLTITPAPLTITAGSGSKVYDGTPLTNDSYTSTALAKGDHIESVTVTGSQTEVGTGANVPSSAVILNEADEDVTKNYNITYVNGDLTVDPIMLNATVSGSADKRSFTSEAQTYTGTITATSTDPRFDVSKFRYTGSTKVTGTKAGDYTTPLSAENCVYDDKNYAVNWTIGDPIKLTITQGNNSTTKSPKTGVDAPITGPLFAMILCLVIFAAFKILSRREKY